jgi:hypothetical protein
MAMELQHDVYLNQSPGDRTRCNDASVWSDPITHCAIYGRSKLQSSFSGLIGLYVQFRLTTLGLLVEAA